MLQENIKAIKIAVQLFNRSDVKETILHILIRGFYVGYDLWQKPLNEKAKDIIKELNVTEEIKQEVAGMVNPIAQRILIWATYHDDVFYLPYDYAIKFLNDTFFTEQGIIDSEKVAKEIKEKLVKDENLNIKIRYKLACVYCLEREFSKDIIKLWNQLTKKDKQYFYNVDDPKKIKQPELVKFSTYHINGQIETLKKGMSTCEYRFVKAIENCSEVVVKYYWPKLNQSAKGKIVNFAMQVLKYKNEKRKKYIPSYMDFPVECYDDILYFLISEMKEKQKIEFFKNDIEEAGYSQILDVLLEWPYQDSFMEAANLMWGILSGKNYAKLLLRITNRFTGKKKKIKNDYRKLSKEFWSQSPDEYKRYILSDEREHDTLKGLLLKSFELRETSSTSSRLTSIIDKKNIELIELILNDATPKEKENIISFYEWKLVLGKIMIQEKWELLEELVNNSTSSTEGANQFKRGFTSSRIISEYLIKQGNFALMDKIEKWSLKSEEEIAESKKKLVLSDMAGIGCCKNLIVEGKLELADKFVKWGLKSEEEIKEFKKTLTHNRGNYICHSLKSDLELIDKFVKWGLESEEEIKEFKKEFAYNSGSRICESLIAESIEEDSDDQGNPINPTLKFYGGQWERVEMFLTWAFSSEEEICEFKKELFEASGVAIHSNLIFANRWEEAETFFAWLELSKQEIKELKKKNLFSDWMFMRLIFSKDDNWRFLVYGGRQQAIELFLRWHLIDLDEEAILEFRDKFRHKFDRKYITIKDDFDLAIEQCLSDLAEDEKAIEQCLSDLAEDEKGVKRKTEASDLPSKKIFSTKVDQQTCNQHL